MTLSGADTKTIAQTITTGIMCSFIVLLPTTVLIFVFRRARPGAPSNPHRPGALSNRRRKANARVRPASVTGAGVELGTALGITPESAAAAQGKRGSTDSGMRFQIKFKAIAQTVLAAKTLFDDVQEDARTGWTRGGPDEKKKFLLPGWARRMAWMVSVGLAVWCCYYVLLLSFEWGPMTSWRWLSAVVTSVVMMSAVTDPFFILFLALVMSTVVGGIGEGTPLVEGKPKEVVLASTEQIDKLKKQRGKGSECTSRPPEAWVEQRRKQAKNDAKVKAILWEVIRYLVFYATVLVVFMTTREDQRLVFVSNVVNTVAGGSNSIAIWDGVSRLDSGTGFSEITNEAEWWDWAEESLTNMYVILKL